MKYKAVIFDLGGTLSPSAAWSEYASAARQIARLCSLPEEKFVEAWFTNSSGLGIGIYPRYQDYVKHVCRILNHEVADTIIEKAGEIPLRITKEYVLKPREGAIEVLEYLKSQGYKLGLISDCAYDIPALWPESVFAPYFDIPVFSCDTGMNKAEPEIFKIALKKMGVTGKDCVYIADGMRKELTHASALGMKAIQLFIPEERKDNSPIREDWHGATISSLREIYNLL